MGDGGGHGPLPVYGGLYQGADRPTLSTDVHRGNQVGLSTRIGVSLGFAELTLFIR